jgi:hypothetical protein
MGIATARAAFLFPYQYVYIINISGRLKIAHQHYLVYQRVLIFVFLASVKVPI